MQFIAIKVAIINHASGTLVRVIQSQLNADSLNDQHLGASVGLRAIGFSVHHPINVAFSQNLVMALVVVYLLEYKGRRPCFP